MFANYKSIEIRIISISNAQSLFTVFIHSMFQQSASVVESGAFKVTSFLLFFLLAILEGHAWASIEGEIMKRMGIIQPS